MTKSHSSAYDLEIIIPESSPEDIVRTINGLTAQYRKDYYLSEIYLYNGKGKLTFSLKEKEAA